MKTRFVRELKLCWRHITCLGFKTTLKINLAWGKQWCWIQSWQSFFPNFVINKTFWRCFLQFDKFSKQTSTKFFLVLISPYSVWIQENTDQKKLRIWKLFTQCQLFSLSLNQILFFSVTSEKSESFNNKLKVVLHFS